MSEKIPRTYINGDIYKMEKQKNYERALELAVKNLKQLQFDEILEKIKFSGAYNIKTGNNSIEFEIFLFKDIIKISYPDFIFSKSDGNKINLVSKNILLHYLEKITPYIKTTDELVSYKHIPGAFNYYTVFQKKVTIPLLSKYNSLDKFQEIFNKIEVEPINLGDSAFKIKALPKIDINVIYWDGDEEFPPNLDFLFDSSIGDLLSLEDIVVISQMFSKRLLFL